MPYKVAPNLAVAQHVPPEEELNKLDVIDTIAQNMADRGFTSLWGKTSVHSAVTFDDRAKRDYLIRLATTGIKGQAAAFAGVTSRITQIHVKSDPAFAAAVEEAMGFFRDLIQAEMYRRGVEGFHEEVLGGKNKDEIFKLLKYSDKQLENLGKIHIKAMQKEVSTVINNNNTETKLIASQFDMESMPVEDMAMMKTLLQNQQKRLEDAQADTDAIEGVVVPDGG